MNSEISASEHERYIRQTILPGWGDSGQQRLKSARVLVIGAGGLGAPVLMYLAAAGVGKIGIVDGDFVEENNLHRQVIHGVGDLDTSKVRSAAAKLKKSNPYVDIVEHVFSINHLNADELISQYNFVADCTDNFTTRDIVAEACYRSCVPLVSGAAQMTDGTVTTFTPYLGDGHPCFRCLYPTPLDESLTPSCSQIGVAGPVLAVIGGIQAMELIKEIIGLGSGLSGHILVYNALAGRVIDITLKKSSACQCG